MNRILTEIGWAAVVVDGFIPPNAFMEFQAYNVLVHLILDNSNNRIYSSSRYYSRRCWSRPIIANPEYAEYLRRFGEIGCKAISSDKDYKCMKLYDYYRS
jgi:phenylalanine-4-hydroxylase